MEDKNGQQNNHAVDHKGNGAEGQFRMCTLERNNDEVCSASGRVGIKDQRIPEPGCNAGKHGGRKPWTGIDRQMNYNEVHKDGTDDHGLQGHEKKLRAETAERAENDRNVEQKCCKPNRPGKQVMADHGKPCDAAWGKIRLNSEGVHRNAQ